MKSGWYIVREDFTLAQHIRIEAYIDAFSGKYVPAYSTFIFTVRPITVEPFKSQEEMEEMKSLVQSQCPNYKFFPLRVE